MSLKSKTATHFTLLSLLPLLVAGGCVLDKQSLGDPEGETEGDDAASASAESTGDVDSATSAGSGSAATTAATTDATDPWDCDEDSCGPCQPGCVNEDICVDGVWNCSCACDTDIPEPQPEVCPEDPLDVPSQIAYRYDDRPSPGNGGGGDGGSDTTDGGGPDPDTLVIRLGTEPLACGEPPAYVCDAWSVTIMVPPQYHEPGVYDIDDTEITVGYSIQGPQQSDDPEDCSFGGGGGFGGTLEIFAIDEDAVYGAFCSTDLFEIEADGVFTAERC